MFSSGGPSVRFLTRYDGEVSEPLVGRQGGVSACRLIRRDFSKEQTHGFLAFQHHRPRVVLIIPDRPLKEGSEPLRVSFDSVAYMVELKKKTAGGHGRAETWVILRGRQRPKAILSQTKFF